ncbi:MAG: hypothetical protein Q8Q91_03180 [Candidatus Daviesbacteria bacterium]|nr:hypothetical protein [Candidatus Daviesbacteria bacterium]
MAWVVDFAVTEGTVAAASTGPADMPVHQANDMLIVFAAKDTTGKFPILDKYPPLM